MIFEIPIYRCDAETFYQEAQLEKEQALKYVFGPDREKYRKDNPEIYEEMASRIEAHRFYPRAYNDVVGWLRLYIFDTQIRGELFWIRSRRIRRDHKRRYTWVGKAFEARVGSGDSSSAIYELIMAEIQGVSSCQRYRKRVFDLTAFNNVGPLINWRKLVDL